MEITSIIANPVPSYMQPTSIEGYTSKDVFNGLTASEPVNELCNHKEFKLLGVHVSEASVKDKDTGEMTPMVMYRLFTDVGVFHSVSLTLNSAIDTAVTAFGEEIKTVPLCISITQKNGNSQYVLKAV